MGCTVRNATLARSMQQDRHDLGELPRPACGERVGGRGGFRRLRIAEAGRPPPAAQTPPPPPPPPPRPGGGGGGGGGGPVSAGSELLKRPLTRRCAPTSPREREE